MKKLFQLMLLSSLVACHQSPEEPQTESEIPTDLSEIVLSLDQFSSGNFEISAVSEQEFAEEIVCTGNTEVAPEHFAEVSPIYGGFVSETHLLSGQKVKAGQLLFQLKSPLFIELQEQFLKAKAEYQWQSKDYERLKSLEKGGAIAEKELLERESSFKNAEAEWQALGKKLQLINIDTESLNAANIKSQIAVLAPINGIISELALSKGKYLESGSSALKIIDARNVHLGLQLFEQDLAKIEIGQELKFRLQGQSDWMRAKVQLINPALNPTTGTAYLHAEILDKQALESFYPGMFIEAKILSGLERLPALPLEALVETEESSYLYELVSKDDVQIRFKKVEVRARVHNSEYFSAQVLEPGKEYLSRGAFRLRAD